MPQTAAARWGSAPYRLRAGCGFEEVGRFAPKPPRRAGGSAPYRLRAGCGFEWSGGLPPNRRGALGQRALPSAGGMWVRRGRAVCPKPPRRAGAARPTACGRDVGLKGRAVCPQTAAARWGSAPYRLRAGCGSNVVGRFAPNRRGAYFPTNDIGKQSASTTNTTNSKAFGTSRTVVCRCNKSLVFHYNPCRRKRILENVA